MFGWDIMPRIVSAGIWKPVTLVKNKEDKIKDVYFTTNFIDKKPIQLSCDSVLIRICPAIMPQTIR